MRRRTLFTGLAAVGAAGTAAAVFGRSALADNEAAAARANFKIMATEQVSNRILVFNNGSSLGNGNIHKTLSLGAGGWYNLSDVRRRNTAKQGAIGLVAASGGNVGAWDLTGEKHQERNDLLWWASPGGNPHAFERIQHFGAFVAASSDGYLTVYAPRGSRGQLKRIQHIGLPGAHGVLWDPTYKRLWAIGDYVLRTYSVTGSGSKIKLHPDKKVSIPGKGHDLQPDYSDKQRLLITDSKGVYEVTKSVWPWKVRQISGTNGVKSYVRHSSGEDFWITADGKKPRTWGSPVIRFKSGKASRSGAEFYKVRAFDLEY